MKHNIGIMQGRLTEPKGRGLQFFPFENWKEEFYDAVKLGLDEIEFIFDYENYQDNPLWSKNGIQEIKKTITGTGIKVRAVCFDYFMRRPFYKELDKKRDELRKENTIFIENIISAMNEIGIDLLEIPSVDNSSIKNEEEKQLYREWIKEIASGHENIRFGMEMDLESKPFLEFIKSIACNNVGANYDSGNSSGLGYNLYEEVTTLRDKIFNIHIKDRKLHGPTRQLGTGSANFDELFRGLKEIGYSYAFILQAARGDEGDELNNIKWQKEYIEKLIEKYKV